MDIIKNISSMLKDKNLKLTPQRIAIFQLLNDTDKHPSAEILYNQLLTVYPTMSFATVYKTLDLLKKNGLIRVLHIGEDCFRYDADCSDHMHFFCNECHELIDLQKNNHTKLIVDDVVSKGHVVNEEFFYFKGTCKKCLDKNR